TGGPAACAYLLGHPDHYTDRQFRVVFWRSYVKRAMSTGYDEDRTGDVTEQESDSVLVGKSNDDVVALNRNWTLYSYLTRTTVRKRRRHETFATQARQQVDVIDENLGDHIHADSDLSEDSDEDGDDDRDDHGDDHDGQMSASCKGLYQYLQQHPLHRTHGVLILNRAQEHVLNFTGGVLPRKDHGDYAEYCIVMLMLFKPGGWRSGKDLRGQCVDWETMFKSTEFSTCDLQIMKNMNLLYECLDERDDYNAQRHARESADGQETGQNISPFRDEYMGSHDDPFYEVSHDEHSEEHLLNS
ncbi:hypothetical protein A0H81_09546, partial [Grifola frondosa]